MDGPEYNHNSVALTRLILDAAASGGADRQALSREAGIPPWMLADDGARAPSRLSLRLWELAEWSLGGTDTALRMAGGHYEPGRLGLYDYLFTSASTLGEALAVSSRYVHTATTSVQMAIDEDGDEVSLSYRLLGCTGRTRDLAMQFALGVFCTRTLRCGARPVAPVRAGLVQPPPRRSGPFADVFGTSDIDFGTPVDTLTFRRDDLATAIPGAEPGLAAVLRRYAATLPGASVEPTTWEDRFRRAVEAALPRGDASLQNVARALLTSPRTLQRRLAESGTSWRAELDAARYRRAEQLRADPAADPRRLARELGYSDARALRRARHRWPRP